MDPEINTIADQINKLEITQNDEIMEDEIMEDEIMEDEKNETIFIYPTNINFPTLIEPRFNQLYST